MGTAAIHKVKFLSKPQSAPTRAVRLTQFGLGAWSRPSNRRCRPGGGGGQHARVIPQHPTPSSSAANGHITRCPRDQTFGEGCPNSLPCNVWTAQFFHLGFTDI